MKIITLWISMVYLGISFVNAQSPGMACCGDVEYDPATTTLEDESIEIKSPNNGVVNEILDVFGVSHSGSGSVEITNKEEGQACCRDSDTLIDYTIGDMEATLEESTSWSPDDIILISAIVDFLEKIPFVQTKLDGDVTCEYSASGSGSTALDADGCDVTTSGDFSLSAEISAGISVEVDLGEAGDEKNDDPFEADFSGSLSGSVSGDADYTPADLSDAPSASDFDFDMDGEICWVLFVDLPFGFDDIDINDCWPKS